jgi:hypothetical protein
LSLAKLELRLFQLDANVVKLFFRHLANKTNKLERLPLGSLKVRPFLIVVHVENFFCSVSDKEDK